MITNYAIIDHVGQVANISEVYAKAFSLAIGYEKVYTLKKVCQIHSPYAKEVTNKMKWYNRYNRHPKKVYIVCPLVDTKAEFVADAWRDRNIEVEFVTEEPDPTIGTEKTSRARRCALIWAQALGWEFSNPLFRNEQPNSIDMYTARPNMDIEDGSYGAKRFTKPESFINAFRAIASEEECERFFQHYAYLYQNNLLSEFLDPDWELCPVCGRPHYITSEQCPWCDTEFDAVEIEAFWEDSYDGKGTNPFSDIDVTHADLATKSYIPYLIDCKVRDSGEFYFPESNEVEAINYSTMTLSNDIDDDSKEPEHWLTRHKRWVAEVEADLARLDG